MGSKLNKLNDTIAALATAPGRAGLAVVRISGPLTKQIAKKTLGYAPKHMAAKYSSFKTAEGEIVDFGTALFFSYPRSYKGEDVLELTCHGGQAIVDQLLEALFQDGARIGERGERRPRKRLTYGPNEFAPLSREATLEAEAWLMRHGIMQHTIDTVREARDDFDEGLSGSFGYPGEVGQMRVRQLLEGMREAQRILLDEGNE